MKVESVGGVRSGRGEEGGGAGPDWNMLLYDAVCIHDVQTRNSDDDEEEEEEEEENKNSMSCGVFLGGEQTGGRRQPQPKYGITTIPAEYRIQHWVVGEISQGIRNRGSAHFQPSALELRI